MLNPVPLFILFYIFNTKVCAEVDHLCPGKNPFIYKRSAKPLRCCRKDHIHFICQSFHIIIHTFCIHQFKKVLIDSCVFLINIASGSIPDHFCFFMSQQKSCQLVSRIAGGSDNSCFYHNKFSSFVHTASSFYVCVCRFCQDDKIIHLLCIICNNYFSQYILFFQSLFI